jgi:hypothetical protein
MKKRGPRTAVQIPSGKHPKSLSPTTLNKQPHTTYSADPMKMTPSWRIALAQIVDPWGWHGLDADGLMSIRVKLSEYEAKTWNEILVKQCHFNHRIECHKLCREAQNRLAELGLDDIEQLISLRLGSCERVWGILNYNVLDLLWWDPDHLVYPVFKQHT